MYPVESLKTYRERQREEELMAKLMEIVNDRNAILEGLDEDRLRCAGSNMYHISLSRISYLFHIIYLSKKNIYILYI